MSHTLVTLVSEATIYVPIIPLFYYPWCAYFTDVQVEHVKEYSL